MTKNNWMIRNLLDDHAPVPYRERTKQTNYIGVIMRGSADIPRVVACGGPEPVSHLSINLVVDYPDGLHITRDSTFTLNREQLEMLYVQGWVRDGEFCVQLLEEQYSPREKTRAKVISLLRRDGAAPQGMFALGMFFNKHLDADDMAVFDAIEAELGEAGANRWLCDLLVETGMYNSDGEYVEAVSRAR